nr:HAMP domain-containing histidine kinase [Ktedonobacterales bacterium]
EHHLPTRIIVLAQQPTVRGATAALRAGATDYLGLRSATATVMAAIQRASTASSDQHSPTHDGKDDLISLVSHELRSPLMAINGYLEILQRYHDRISPEKAQDYIKRSLQATGELAYLSDLLVQVMYYETGHVPMKVGPLPLAPIVQAAIAQCEGGTSQHTLRCDVAPTLLVRGDALALQQVLRNLLSNAIKYSPQGGTITVTAWSTADEQVCIAVRDEGMGIAAEQMPQLFGRFARLHDVTRWPHIRGTGLGLYICRQLVGAQGGRIWAESTPGQGSTFFVQLPMADARALAPTA